VHESSIWPHCGVAISGALRSCYAASGDFVHFTVPPS
jgi:hypothetical protein